MQLGDWDITIVSGGTLRLDGGAMFGVVPKPLWSKVSPPDEQNRIRMATNCLLARDGRYTLLIDTGYGGKLSERERQFVAAEEGEPLLKNLAKLGVKPGDITHVLLTHLHFDHCGGATRYDGDAGQRIVTSFPRARYFVSRQEWQLATRGAPELRGSYPPENLTALADSPQLTLLDEPGELLPGLDWLRVPGHTDGHVAYRLAAAGQTVLYPCDVCPTTAHLPVNWCMAYDTHMVETRRRKLDLLGRAADEGWLVVWAHDPDIVAGRLVRDPRRDFTLAERLTAL